MWVGQYASVIIHKCLKALETRLTVILAAAGGQSGILDVKKPGFCRASYT